MYSVELPNFSSVRCRPGTQSGSQGIPGDPAVLEQLGLEALDAADDLLEAPVGRDVLRNPIVVILLREIVNVAAAPGKRRWPTTKEPGLS